MAIYSVRTSKVNQCVYKIETVTMKNLINALKNAIAMVIGRNFQSSQEFQNSKKSMKQGEKQEF